MNNTRKITERNDLLVERMVLVESKQCSQSFSLRREQFAQHVSVYFNQKQILRARFFAEEAKGLLETDIPALSVAARATKRTQSSVLVFVVIRDRKKKG